MQKKRRMKSSTPSKGEDSDYEVANQEDDIKEETYSSEEEFDSSKYGLSEYELLRKENVEKNLEMFQQFNVVEAKQDFKEISTKKKKLSIGIVGMKRPIKKRIIDENTPRRVSLRLQKIKADLDALPKELPRISNGYTHNYDERKPTEIKMENEEDTSCKEMIEKLAEISDECCKREEDPLSEDLQKYKQRVKALKVKNVGKIVSSRIFAVTVHPAEEKTVAFISGKHGDIGVWDVGSDADNDGIIRFEPHSSPINCLKFLPNDASKIYSCSYDGTIRCGDLRKQQFNQVFGFDESIASRFHYFDWPCDDNNALYAVTSDGEVLHVDIRSGKCESENRISGRSCKCIDFHPTNGNFFAACFVDGTVTMWDRRKTVKAGSHVSQYKAGRSVSTGFFSPHTGNKFLLTSQDDYLRVISVNETGNLMFPPLHEIKHDNYVTRWLTTFRASWDPKTDNCFVCGSMARPRQIDVYGCGEGKQRCHIPLTDDNFNSVNSVVAFHPTKDVIVGGNSSGKVYVWS